MATLTRERLKELVKEVMVEETEYQQFFSKALEKAGKSIPSMSDEEKKEFFDKIDAAWTGRGEKNEELVGNQHKLDVDKDGDIEADDLADLRAGKKVEEAADLRAIRMLIQNKGIKDAVRKHHADNLRKIIEDEGFSTKGVSDSELIKIGKILTNESVNEGVSPKDMDKIKAAVQNASSFMGVGAELKKVGLRYIFATEPLAIYIVQPTPNVKIAILNKKYASGPDFVHGDIAVGIMESKINEAEADIKVGDMVKVDNPHWEGALGKKGPFKRKVKMIDHDSVFFTDGSNSSMKYVKK